MEDVIKERSLDYQQESGKKLKVLILEDMFSDAELVKLYFEELDFHPEYRVTEKREEYIKHLKFFKPDIIISDFNLPNFDGLKALKILRSDLGDDITPFVFVTGTLGEENAVKAIKGGATDFIVKERVNQLPAAVIRALREKHEKLRRKEASKREQIKERRFKKLVQEGSDLIAITDYKGNIHFLSDNYEKILGYPASEIIGKNTFDLVPSEDKVHLKEAFKIIKDKRIVKVEPYRILDESGRLRWLQSTLTNLYDDDAVVGIVMNSHEVTELKEHEQALKLSNEKYYYASIATRDILYDWDLINDTISRDGEALHKMYGHDPVSFNCVNFWMDQIHPEDIIEVHSQLKKCLKDKSQTLYQQEYRLKRSNGSYAFIHDIGYILRDSKGNALRLIGATRDISEQKERDQLKDLILSISTSLSKPSNISQCMNEVLKVLNNHIGGVSAEFWLPANHNNHLILSSKFSTDQTGSEIFKNTRQLLKTQGLPGEVYTQGKAILWDNIPDEPKFLRNRNAKKAQFKSVFGVPVLHGSQTIGVFLFFSREKEFPFTQHSNLLLEISQWISPELKRKHASEELDNFFNTSTDLLCILGIDGSFKKVNPAFTTLLGYSESELLSNPIKHFLHSDDHIFTKSHLNELQEKMKSTHLENRIITKDGGIKWFSWSAIYQLEDEVIFAVGKEITEKKRLQELIEDSQIMAKVGSWEFDLIDQSIHWTSQTKEIHEVPPDYQPNYAKSLNFYKEGESQELIKRCVDEGISQGKGWDIELQIITAKGMEKWVRVKGKAEMREGKCVRLFGSFQDIDDHKKREDDLRLSYQRFALASKATREAIYEWDCQTNDVTWTYGYIDLFGYDTQKSNFDDWESKIHLLDRDRIVTSVNNFLAKSDEHFWKDEYRFIRKDNKVAFVEDRGYVIRDNEGNPISMIGSVNDLTEKKMFQEQLLENTIQSQEKERNRIAQELHDGIVQEMVVCSMRSDLLHKINKENPQLDEKISEITDFIKQITNSTRNISHNLLSANVAEMTFQELLERLDLNLRLVSQIKFNIEHFLGSDLKLDETIKINLYRVIQELTNNIIKHSGATKTLILVEKINEEISVKVTDNGKGMDKSQSANGIGLSNVSNRINMIGGKIKFANLKEGGLQVSITVPI